jgi:hypothetical protein
LTFAKMFLEKVKEVDEGRVLTQDEMKTIIKHGGNEFNARTSADEGICICWTISQYSYYPLEAVSYEGIGENTEHSLCR